MNNSNSTHSFATQSNGDTVTRMDALAQSGFSAIAALAQKALAGLDAARSTYPNTEALAADLGVIWATAEQFCNDINVKAEEARLN